MILWLPLQGFAAVAMPFCKHGFHASTSALMVSPSLAHAGAEPVDRRTPNITHQHHAGHARTHHQDSSPGGLGCNDCGVCHLACSPVAPTSLSPIERGGTQSFFQFSPVLPPTFVPEQRTPPPLNAIA